MRDIFTSRKSSPRMNAVSMLILKPASQRPQIFPLSVLLPVVKENLHRVVQKQGVTVQIEHIFSLCNFKRPIVRRSKTQVFIVLYQNNPREFRPHHLDRAVRRAVVTHYNLKVYAFRLFKHGTQTVASEFFCIVVYYYYAYIHNLLPMQKKIFFLPENSKAKRMNNNSNIKYQMFHSLSSNTALNFPNALSQVNCLMNSFPFRANRFLKPSSCTKRKMFCAKASTS